MICEVKLTTDLESKKKKVILFMFIIPPFSCLCISRHSLYPFFFFNNTIILSISSSDKHTCTFFPPSFTLAHTWLCVSAYNQPLLKDTHINQRQAHLFSMYGSLISPDAAYRLIVKSHTLLQGQNT